jgi:hypothetical protein
MTLRQARDDYTRWDALVHKFPGNHAINRARLQAYEQWLVAVRYWRLNHG